MPKIECDECGRLVDCEMINGTYLCKRCKYDIYGDIDIFDDEDFKND